MFVFPGQGSQWVGMAVGLLGSSPVFAARVAECEVALAAYVDWSLSGVLRGEAGAPGLDRTDVVQPVLWAVMVSLARTWQQNGVEPAAVVGHSQGEIAAACIAGALSLDDAAKIVVLRSQLFADELVGNGAVASVALPVEETRKLIEQWPALSIAGINSPNACTVAGAAPTVAHLALVNDRTHIFAGQFNYPIGDVLNIPINTAMRGEIAYLPDKPYNISMFPGRFGLKASAHPKYPNGVVEKDTLRYALGFDRSTLIPFLHPDDPWRAFNLSFQIFQNIIFKHEDGIHPFSSAEKIRKLSTTFTFRVSTGYLGDTILPDVFVAYDPEGYWSANPAISWTIVWTASWVPDGTWTSLTGAACSRAYASARLSPIALEHA